MGNSDVMGKVVGIAVGVYVTAYVAVPALIELAYKAANTTLAATPGGALTSTLLPVLVVIALAMMFMKARK